MKIIPFVLCVTAVLAQDKIPLDAVKAKGTALSAATVQEIAALRTGAPIDKAGMEAACKQLADSGLFGSINYEYALGPKRGYILTLDLSDQPSSFNAVIDIPDINEDDVWRWIGEKYPTVVRHIPETAENFVAGQIEEHLKASLAGQHVVVRMEVDLITHRQIAVFQPENLPKIAALNFVGIQEFHSEVLSGMLQKTMGSDGYSERRLRVFLNGVIRQAYEDHGMYRVGFTKITTHKTGPAALSVTTDIAEGPKFTLSQVELVGDNLPRDAMLKAASFDIGKTASWREIQQKIYASELPLKRTGYYEATAEPRRILHDDQRQLELQVPFRMGPLYHFGQVTFVGLPANATGEARRLWKMQAGDPYDFAYLNDFLKEFSKSLDLRMYKIAANPQKAPGKDPVMNETITFAPK